MPPARPALADPRPLPTRAAAPGLPALLDLSSAPEPDLLLRLRDGLAHGVLTDPGTNGHVADSNGHGGTGTNGHRTGVDAHTWAAGPPGGHGAGLNGTATLGGRHTGELNGTATPAGGRRVVRGRAAVHGAPAVVLPLAPDAFPDELPLPATSVAAPAVRAPAGRRARMLPDTIEPGPRSIPRRPAPGRGDPYRELSRREGPDPSEHLSAVATATRTRPVAPRQDPAGGDAPTRLRRTSRHGASRSRRPMPFWQEFPLLVIVAFSLALLIKSLLLQAFFIPSGSMENTLQVRDRVLVNKVVYDLREPRRGEVVVFRGTESWAPEVSTPRSDGIVASIGRSIGGALGFAEPDEKDFIKRVIGVPGDVVRCCDAAGRVTVNGHPLDESYVFDDTPIGPRTFGPVTVPAGRLFVLGDHRRISADSREYILEDRWQGTVPIDQVIGRAVVTVWPAGHWRRLPVPETFADVPDPAARPAALGSGSAAGSVPADAPADPAPEDRASALPAVQAPTASPVRSGRHRRAGWARPRTLTG